MDYLTEKGIEKMRSQLSNEVFRDELLSLYLRENPGVNNKSYLARQLGMAITTVQKYYDEVRAELRGEESPVPQT